MATPQLPRQYPLHVHIATVFVGMILLVGLGLSVFSYHRTSHILLDSAEGLFDGVVQDLEMEFQSTYGPVSAMVETMVHTGVVSAQHYDQRLQYLPLLEAAVRMRGQLATLQIGYASGDFFIVRPAHFPGVSQLFDAPADTHLVVDNVARADDELGHLLRFFFDEELQLIEQRQLGTTDYDPRQRGWYREAMASDGLVTVEPYLYFFLRQIGVTTGQRAPAGQAVIAADISLGRLSQTIVDRLGDSAAEIALIDDQGQVLAYPEMARLLPGDLQELRLTTLEELDRPALLAVHRQRDGAAGSFNFDLDNRGWWGSLRSVELLPGLQLYLAVAVPEAELLADAMAIRNQSLLFNLLLVLLALPLALWLAHRIAVPLRRLASEARAIQRFDFSGQIDQSSLISEINQLTRAMAMMKHTIMEFLQLINNLAGEQDFDQMLKKIIRSTHVVSGADLVGIYLLREEDGRLHPECVEVLQGQGFVALRDMPTLHPNATGNALAEVFRGGEKALFSYCARPAGRGVLDLCLAGLGQDRMQTLVLPLCDRKMTPIGLLLLGMARAEQDPLRDGWQGFVEALSGFAAVSMESRQLISRQKELLASFIRLIAGAIDAKSPYTGGHCQRVPELTKMLARAACQSKDGPFADFDLTRDQWDELHLAAWLHDCGKVVTPEHVVDKATKLETIYDRIHEVRTRFEVLKRDAAVACWQRIADGASRQEQLAELTQTEAELDAEFAFVAQCNIGGETLEPAALARLQSIAGRTWLRTLDDSLGVSWEERQRQGERPPLPVREPLLADRPEHRLRRSDRDRTTMAEGNPWGFNMEQPEYLYNRGELHNLSIARGTLTPEERYIINDHIVQTIIMLESLPYPPHLRNVPAIAGGHHEKMDGTGYPRGLKREEMPLTARMMAIADIFEALTARDRPYKPGRTLSESLAIMADMSREQHIDSDLFELFLVSGVYKDYAEQYLLPEHRDAVDIQALIG